jgi:arginine deiminase
MKQPLHIASEVDNLRAVLLHRPGKELESLTPQFLESMLFEDIPYLAQMQIEHDLFAQTLRDNGATVYYLEALLEEVFKDPSIHLATATHLASSSPLFSPSLKKIINKFLTESTPSELVDFCIGGVLKTEVAHLVKEKTLSYFIKDTFPYYISPLPNLYFTRDPATIVNGGMNINVMKAEYRKRESYLLTLLSNHHPLFSSSHTHADYTQGSSIEGGDILIINEECAVIGSSARTDVWAIESFAHKMMSPIENGGEGLKEVLVVQIPFTRAYMHLDTVFTMVSYDKFCLFPLVEPSIKVFSLTISAKGSLHIREQKNLKTALAKALHLPSVDIIRSGGNDSIASSREQWNDSTNTLAVAPGVVVAYRRNVVSNETLTTHGINVIPIKGSELVRGRGGPRCMSMPLYRSKE